jgi:hypothetical protein
VEEVQPVADLVRGGPAEVERRGRRPLRPEPAVQDHDAVGVRGPARELCVAQQVAAQLTHPDVQVAVCGPRIGSACRCGLDRIPLLGERRRLGLRPGDSVRRVAARVPIRQEELDTGVGCDRLPHTRDLADVGVGPSEVVVEDVDLTLDLSVGDVLSGHVPHDVDDDRIRVMPVLATRSPILKARAIVSISERAAT